jgi:hypothetical protein
MASNVNTDLGADVTQNGWVACSPRMGLIEAVIDLDDMTYSTAGDWISVFTFAANTVVLAAGLEVVTKTTGACNATLGVAGDNSILTASALGTAGVNFASTATVPIQFAADAVLTLAASASPAGGEVRVWAVVLDPSSLVTG